MATEKSILLKCIVLVLLLGVLVFEARRYTVFEPQKPHFQTCPSSDMVKELEDLKSKASSLELMIKEKEIALMERELLITEREKLLEEKFKCVTPLQNDIDAIQCVMQQQSNTQKKLWQQPVVSLASHVETIKNKAINGYEVSRDTIKPHLVKAQESLSPHVQTVKDLSAPYVDQVVAASRPRIEKVVAASQPHIERLTVILKPYTNIVAHAYKRFRGPVPQIKDRDS